MTTYYDKIIDAFSHAMFNTDMVSARLMLGLSEFVWAVLLLWPGDTFGRPTYAIMAMIMPEDCWGILFFFTSMMQFGIIASKKYHSREARYFAAYNALLWVFVIISMLKSVYPPPAAISAEIVMALASSWIWFRPYLMCKWIINARKRIQV